MQKKLLALCLLGFVAKGYETLPEETLESIIANQAEELDLITETENTIVIKAPPRGFLRADDGEPSEPFDPASIVESLQDVVKPLSETIGSVVSWVTGDEQQTGSSESEKVETDQANIEEAMDKKEKYEEREEDSKIGVESEIGDENEIEGVEEREEYEEKFETEERLEAARDIEEGFEEYVEKQETEKDEPRSFLRAAIVMKEEQESLTTDINQEEKATELVKGLPEQEENVDSSSYERMARVEEEDENEEGQPDGDDDDDYREERIPERRDDDDEDIEVIISDEDMKTKMADQEVVEISIETLNFYQKLYRMFAGDEADAPKKKGYYDGL